jgi:ankyrin repeat protein
VTNNERQSRYGGIRCKWHLGIEGVIFWLLGADVGREGKTLDRLREKVTAVSIAANGKYSELAKWLMDNGAPVANRNQVMLVDASRRGDVSEINKLLAEGAKTDQPDPLTNSLPLNAAAEEGHGDAVAALLKAGASIAVTKQMSPVLIRTSAARPVLIARRSRFFRVKQQ